MGEGQAPLLVCEGLKKAFGEIRALQGVDVRVAGGEVLGIAGPNGAGKSTLLGVIGGQIRVDGGKVLLAGREVQRKAPQVRRRLGIARTFQATRIYARMTVEENLLLACEYADRRWPGAVYRRSSRRRAQELLVWAGLAEKAQFLAGTLPIYDQKLLMLLLAVARPPRILLLDEPAGGLTPDEIERLKNVISELTSEGIAVVIVDHVMSFLQGVVDRMLVMHQGKVIIEGSPKAIAESSEVQEVWLGSDGA
jgi:branched-chain amino acid transport system ATP-binding protein